MNGSGKTNLLEAISLLSLTRSFRGAQGADMCQWNKEFYRVQGMVTCKQSSFSLELVSQFQPRKQHALFRDNVRLRSSKFFGNLLTVTFVPQNMDLFDGAPAERRTFFDRLLSQISLEYRNTLGLYQKSIRQRNAALRAVAKGTTSRELLDPWDCEVAAYGSKITIDRLALIETLNMTLIQELHGLGESWEEAEIQYKRRGEAQDPKNCEEEYLALLQQERDRDILLQSTTVGPHRHDWTLMLDGRSISSFASRGQHRVCVLALVLLQASYLELQKSAKPIILLDDVFSELDAAHQDHLLSVFNRHQVLITSTHIPEGFSAAEIQEVSEGKVRVPFSCKAP